MSREQGTKLSFTEAPCHYFKKSGLHFIALHFQLVSATNHKRWPVAKNLIWQQKCKKLVESS